VLLLELILLQRVEALEKWHIAVRERIFFSKRKCRASYGTPITVLYKPLLGAIGSRFLQQVAYLLA
jgi:hypothetical protein